MQRKLGLSAGLDNNLKFEVRHLSFFNTFFLFFFSQTWLNILFFWLLFVCFFCAGLVGLAISYALSVTDRLSGMVTSFTETEKQMVSVERAVQYIEDVPSEVSPHGTVSKQLNCTLKQTTVCC